MRFFFRLYNFCTITISPFFKPKQLLPTKVITEKLGRNSFGLYYENISGRPVGSLIVNYCLNKV